MSWCIQKTIGKPDKVKESVGAQFDAAAKNYEGKTEAQDVLACKAQVGAWLDEVTCTDKEGVSVEASGSRGDYSLSISAACSKIPLLV